MSEMSRIEELKSELAEIIEKKINKQLEMMDHGRTHETGYTVLDKEIKDAIYALDSAVLENDEQIHTVFSQTTSGSVYNAIHKYIHGVEPDELNVSGILPPKSETSNP